MKAAGSMLRRAGLAGLALAALGAAVALAADATVVAENTSYGATANPSIPEGGSLDFTNNDVSVLHNVTAVAESGGQPLFKSETFSGPGTRPVQGIEFLPAGSYSFLCTVHPFMTGTLQVTTSGTPVARPEIEVAIPFQRLRRVRKTGRLKVRVRAVTRSSGIALVAKKGRRRIARRSNLSLAAGEVRRLRLRLSRAGRRALRRVRRARITLTGTVPFGLPDRARRTLR